MPAKHIPLHNIHPFTLLRLRTAKHPPELRPDSQIPTHILEAQYIIVSYIVNILPWAAALTPSRHLHPDIQLTQSRDTLAFLRYHRSELRSRRIGFGSLWAGASGAYRAYLQASAHGFHTRTYQHPAKFTNAGRLIYQTSDNGSRGSPTPLPISINPPICARYKTTPSTLSLFGNVPSTTPFVFLHIRTQWSAPRLDRTHLTNISNMPTTAKIPSRHLLVLTILPLFGICRALWLNPVGSDARTCPSLANTTTQPLL